MLDMDPGLNRQTGAKELVGVFVLDGGKVDADRNPLHNFYIIAGGVFRREQAQHGARCAPNLSDLSLIGFAGGVDLNVNGLAGRHVAQLRLLEVGRDPQIFKRNQGKQVLADGNVLVNFNALASDDAGSRSDNPGIAEVEFGLIKLSLGLGHLGQSGLGAGTLQCHLLRAGLGGVVLGLGLALPIMGGTDAFVGGALSSLSVRQSGLGTVIGGYGCIPLLLADHILVNQRLVAGQIGIGLGKAGLRRSYRGMGGCELLLSLQHTGATTAQIGVGRMQSTAGIDGGKRHVDVGGSC